ncbi:MAG: DsbA family oxidoreductase [Streptosporangiaceae bacterium]
MSLVVYGDFTDPYSYLASRRVDALVAAGVEVDWRAVEGDRRVPVSGRLLDAEQSAAVKEELAAVTEWLLSGEDLPHAPPSMVPRTEAAVSGYAEAYGAGVADDVRRLLFDAYWVRGVDVGSPGELRTLLAGPILRGQATAHPLREFGYAVTVNREPITTGAYRRIRAWRADWIDLRAGTLPTLVEDGRVVAGPAAVERLAQEITRLGIAAYPAGLPDPARYPEVGVRPHVAWVSQVGRPWVYGLRARAPR